MPVSVHVVEYTGELVAPFNSRQALRLITELHDLAENHPDLRTHTDLLATFADLLVPAPRRPHHRRLDFNGD